MSVDHEPRELSEHDPKNAVINVAEMFIGYRLPHTVAGLETATKILYKQHEDILPPATRTDLQRAVASQDYLIEANEQMVSLALDDNDFEAALVAANYLYAFGEIAYQDSLGGTAFQLSLRAHREFSGKVIASFGHTDSYLRAEVPRILAEISTARQSGDEVAELQRLRGVIHTVALNGTLGVGAKQQFDPFVFVHPLK